MSGRIWPGALCYFNHRAEPENQGAFIRVLEHDPSDDTWTFDNASRPIATWPVGEEGPAVWVRASAELFNVAACAEDLTPITPPPSADTTEDRSPCELESA